MTTGRINQVSAIEPEGRGDKVPERFLFPPLRKSKEQGETDKQI